MVGVQIDDYFGDSRAVLVTCWAVGVAVGTMLMLVGMAGWRLRRRAQ